MKYVHLRKIPRLVQHYNQQGCSRFDSVRFLSKKIIKPKFFLKKTKSNRNRFKPTGFGLVRFGFLEKKPVQTGLAWLFRFGSVFSGLARFFRFDSVLARFFQFGSVFSGFFSVRLGLVFSVPGLKNRNRIGQFFQNFNRFFFTVRFFRLFFSNFLGLIGFSVFLNTPNNQFIHLVKELGFEL